MLAAPFGSRGAGGVGGLIGSVRGERDGDLLMAGVFKDGMTGLEKDADVGIFTGK